MVGRKDARTQRAAPERATSQLPSFPACGRRDNCARPTLQYGRPGRKRQMGELAELAEWRKVALSARQSASGSCSNWQTQLGKAWKKLGKSRLIVCLRSPSFAWSPIWPLGPLLSLRNGRPVVHLQKIKTRGQVSRIGSTSPTNSANFPLFLHIPLALFRELGPPALSAKLAGQIAAADP